MKVKVKRMQLDVSEGDVGGPHGIVCFKPLSVIPARAKYGDYVFNYPARRYLTLSLAI